MLWIYTKHGAKNIEYDTKVIGISNNLSKEQQTEKVYKHIQSVIKHFNYDIIIEKEEVIVIDDYVGEGYSKPTEGMINVIKFYQQNLFSSYLEGRSLILAALPLKPLK